MLNFGMNMPLLLMALYGSIMIIIVCLLHILLKNRLPKFVFPLLWCFILIRLLVPFSLSSPISAPVPTLTVPVSRNVVSISDSPIVEDLFASSITYSSWNSSLNWSTALLAIYGIGLLVSVAILYKQRQTYMKKIKQSLLLEHNETINTLLRETGMGHILVFTNDEIASPLVCGMFRPRIYLPTKMDFENTQLLAHILQHETMHIKRGDNWIKSAMLVAICLNWYNPLVWLMSKLLASDLEMACDAAVLTQMDNERQEYATSLLTMAISGSRSTLLYSAFSKVEVERRIRSVLQYKKSTALTLTLSLVLLLSSTVIFATGGQAPFSRSFTGICGSSSSKWCVRADLNRDIYLDQSADLRAKDIIYRVLESNKSNDSQLIQDEIHQALATEFNVEKRAFDVKVLLCLSDKEQLKEYENQGITFSNEGVNLYKNETIRHFSDEMLSYMSYDNSGNVDIQVIRDSKGNITQLRTFHKGDVEYDRYTSHFNHGSNVTYDVQFEKNTESIYSFE